MQFPVWIILALLFLLLCVIACMAYASDVALAHARHAASERAALVSLTVVINQKLQSIQRDLLYLSRERLFVHMISAGDAAAEAELTEEWLAFSRSKTIYDKIRWIDESGRERIRINYAPAETRAVPAEALQDRSLRYFFQDTLRLQPMEIYMSPFDLNVEGEQIEQPPRPALRFGTPAFDSEGRRHGILMLNYSGNSLFARMKQALPESAERLWLLNADGYWLYSACAEDCWGFMLGRPDLTLAARQPTVWARILAQRSGQFVTDEGLWSFDTVYPLLEGQKTSSGSTRLFSPSQDVHASKQYFWKVVSLLPLADYHAPQTPARGPLHRFGRSLFRLPVVWREAAQGWFGRHDELAQEVLAARVIEHTAQGVMITDAAMRVQLVNAAFSRITGYSAGETVGRTPFFLQEGDHPTEFYQSLWAQVIKDMSWQGEVWCRRKNGELFAEWLSINALRNDRGATTHYVCLFSDITRLKESAQRMEYFAHHDTLTGLANSRLLHARLEHNMQIAQRVARRFAVLFLDLDHFKAVNDHFGHARGDELLKEVARRLARSLRNEDTLARIGGDEFVVLLENAATPTDAQRVIDDITAQFPCIVADDKASVEVGISIGLAFYPADGNTAATLLGKADHAMYEVKRHHRGASELDETAD
ncbi:MAG TPA: diguanylate cyclase [Rhodocyclaceae bacterium]|nr:diguanylate cyclase [Rhodocyclaceae bacterium]